MEKGYSLLEILIVIAIIGILTGLTYPSYQDYLSKLHKHEGQAALLDLGCRMERYYTNYNTYETATIGTGKATDVLSSDQSSQGWYRLSIKHATQTDYLLQAVPIINSKNNDTLTLNSLGVTG